MSNKHFEGRFEVELKFRLKSKTQFMERLSRIPHETMVDSNTETDWYFDTPTRSLETQNKSLCIRKMEPSGINLWIVKGPEPDRCEATNITDTDKAVSMLKTLGYDVALQIIKTRSIFFVDQFHITVDHLENLGDFAEFAIMTDDEEKLPVYQQELEALAQRFQLTQADRETQSYKQLCTALNESADQR